MLNQNECLKSFACFSLSPGERAGVRASFSSEIPC
jgi:hypothetical protein